MTPAKKVTFQRWNISTVENGPGHFSALKNDGAGHFFNGATSLIPYYCAKTWVYLNFYQCWNLETYIFLNLYFIKNEQTVVYNFDKYVWCNNPNDQKCELI